MEISKAKRASPSKAHFLLLAIAFQHFSAVISIGVTYGTVANDLPPPVQVAQFIKHKTIFNRVKTLDVNSNVIRAFADTEIPLTVTAPNYEIINLTDIGYARRWVNDRINPFHLRTNIDCIAVGNEVIHWGPQIWIDNLVAAMRTLHQALQMSNLTDIKVSTPHALSILSSTQPPSNASFKPRLAVAVLKPMLQFLRETRGPFMVNPYPFFEHRDPKELDFELFKPNRGYYDVATKMNYTNRFDLLLDAVFVSMKKLGYEDVEIVATETGWPWAGELSEPLCSVENAAAYNGGLVRKYNSGEGTPLMPKKKVETYIVGLFNENEKRGPLSEKNWGIFWPDFNPIYDLKS